MSVETLEIEDQVTPALDNIAGGARTAAQQISALRSRLDGIAANGAQQLVSAFGEAAGKAASMSIQLEGVAQAEHAVTTEVQKQIQLQAQIATFDANRLRKTHELQQELAKMQKGAIGGEGGGMGAEIFAAVGGANLLTMALSKTLETAKQIGAEFAHLTYEGAKIAVEMSNAKSEAERVFERFTGSKVAADEMYESVKNLANITGESPEAVAGRMKKLLAEGFKPLLAGNIMQAMADTQAALGDSEASKIEGILEKLHNKGALDSKALNGLARAGVDTQRVYASLASHLHESIDQVKRDLKAGKIAGDEAAAAIAEAVEGKFGGSAQSKADNDVFIMLARVKNDARALFEDIDIGPIKEATKSLFTALEGPGGKELAGGLQDMFGSIFHTLFDPFKGPEGVQKLTNVMHAIAEGAHHVGATVRLVAPAVSWLVDRISELSAAGDGASGSSGFSKIVAGMKLFADSILLLTGLVSTQTLADDISAMFDIDNVKIPDASTIGTRMIDGLENGITSGAARVVDALVGVCTSAVKAAEGVLGIHSPSTVLAHIGDMTAEGFATGIAASDSPAAASSAMASGAAKSAAVSGAPSASGGGGGGRGDVHVTINSPVTVHANDAEGGAAAADAAVPGIQQAHRDAATSYWRDWKEAG